MRRWRELGVTLLVELLGGLRALADGNGGGGGEGGATIGRAYAQSLLERSQVFLQVCNVLNEDYPRVRGHPLSDWKLTSWLKDLVHALCVFDT